MEKELEVQVEPNETELLLSRLSELEGDLNKTKENLKKAESTNTALTREIIGKRQTPVETPQVIRSAKEIATEIQSKKLNKLEAVKLSLEYRDAFKREFDKDPWAGGDVSELELENLEAGYRYLLKEYGHDSKEFTYRFDNMLTEDANQVAMLRANKRKQ